MPDRKPTAREELEILAGKDAEPTPADPATAVRRFLAYAGAWDHIKATDDTRISMATSYPLTVGDVRVIAGIVRTAIGDNE
jgi:hypothetical protein